MTPFRYRLAQLLRLRQAEEEMEKRELQHRISQERAAQESLVQAEDQLDSYLGYLQHAENKGMTAALLLAHRRWVPSLQEQVVHRGQEFTQARDQTEQQRIEVKHARLKTKTLEELRLRLKEAHRQAEQQVSQVQLDELTIQAWPSKERL